MMALLANVQVVMLLVLVIHTSLLNGHRYSKSKRESSTLPTVDEFYVSKDHEIERNITNSRHANSKGAQERSAGWSQWSAWSLCSRTCDGGVSRQLRTCSAPEGCRGEPVRYKICNMQPCSNASTLAAEDSWRIQQCAAHDGSPYGGELFRWRPHRDDAEPCALTCRGTPLHAATVDHDSMTLKMNDEEEEALVIAVLAPRVVDGTRCRQGSLDMCIDGRCQRVGCDLRVGSSRRVDECGICGGDGTTCARPRYHWIAAPASLCSASCGGGYKMSLPLCRDRVSGQDVSEQLCDASAKPAPSVIRCNTHACPYKWYVGEWSACSATCGGGARRRRVLCAGAGPCGGPAPPDTAVCGDEPCPRWITGAWSGCSVSCGSGVQVRGVECGGGRGGCDAAQRPPTTRVCSTGIACLEYHETDAEGEIEDLIPGVVYHTQPLIQQYPPPEAKAEKLIGEQVVPSEATFIKDTDWGPCSVTCGEGYRKREVHCKIFLEFSRTIAKLPDNKCTGPKPPEETERCVMEPCSLAYGTSYGDSNESPPLLSSDSHRSPSYGEPNGRSAPSSTSKSYSWKEKGYTSCSASCLSGVQELIIQCVRDEDQKNASPYMCDPLTKPENRVRTCNDHPCPPRWNYTEFSPCTKSCGIGIQTREVNCIHEVTRGGSNTVVVPSNMCPQPPPPDRQYCNVLDCPVRWHTTDWSRCTKTCGGGIKQRKVECKQLMAQSHLVERPPSLCSASKPPASKPCNAKPCAVDGAAPEIALTNSSFIQHDHKKKTITVKVGASATLFYGTQIKIKCPVKGYNKTKIQWAKDHKFITKSKNFKISKKGALKIHEIGYGDAGVYTCVAGRSSANLTLIVKPRPGEFVSSEEVSKQNAISMDPASNAYNRKDGRYNAIVSSDDSEEQSHEQRPGDFNNRKKMNKNRNNDRTDRVVHVTATTAPRLPSNYDSYDENEDNGLSSQISGKNGPDSTHSSNSGMRFMPNLLLLLSYLQMIWNLRGKFHGNNRKSPIQRLAKKRHLDSKRGLRRRSRSHRYRNLKTQESHSSNVLFIPQEESDVVIVHEKLDRTIYPDLVVQLQCDPVTSPSYTGRLAESHATGLRPILALHSSKLLIQLSIYVARTAC